ncbi:hypothetical protein B0T20DRAFT_275462 [Sordaria brevicollis]|uniref:Uncharacterized protein n=1 Tax=Sordaria brevicollis TaxID=83679 RepID=A0AAE0UA45_SORBR|nr:hypothetical protein B0T20DRAFT_275462 [Sordaria brevicollis]
MRYYSRVEHRNTTTVFVLLCLRGAWERSRDSQPASHWAVGRRGQLATRKGGSFINYWSFMHNEIPRYISAHIFVSLEKANISTPLYHAFLFEGSHCEIPNESGFYSSRAGHGEKEGRPHWLQPCCSCAAPIRPLRWGQEPGRRLLRAYLIPSPKKAGSGCGRWNSPGLLCRFFCTIEFHFWLGHFDPRFLFLFLSCLFSVIDAGVSLLLFLSYLSSLFRIL